LDLSVTDGAVFVTIHHTYLLTGFYHVTACNAMHGIATRKPSVHLLNVWIVTKWKKLVLTFLYHVKNHSC